MATTELWDEFEEYIEERGGELDEYKEEYWIYGQKLLYAIALVMEKVPCSFQEAAQIVRVLLSEFHNNIDAVIKYIHECTPNELALKLPTPTKKLKWTPNGWK